MRKVKIATVSFEVAETPVTKADNLKKTTVYAKEAREEGCDIILFPEWFLYQGTKELSEAMQVEGTSEKKGFKNIKKIAEDVGGESVKGISSIAAENSIYVIGGFLLSDASGKIYNTALLFDRTGKIIGRYDKYQPNPPERKGGISRGNELPVFELDFGKAAIMICNDIYFPEIVRLYSARGAEIVFWMTLICGPTEHNVETMFKARAMDYSVHLVVSNVSYPPPYAPYAGRHLLGRSCVVNYEGNIIADTGHQPGLAVASIDLDRERLALGVTKLVSPDKMKEDILKQVRFKDYAAEYLKLSGKEEL